MIEWDFPELHHIIVCEKFVRFAHYLCMSHFCKSAGWQQQQQQQQQHSVHHHPVSRLKERHIIVYTYEEFSSLKPILLMNSSSLQQQKKKAFECCLESSRYICVKFYTRFLWHPQFPFSFHHSHFLEPVFFLADMRWSKHMCMPKGTYI